MATRTGFKLSNLSKGSSPGILLVFGMIEATLAYFSSSDWMQQYAIGIWIIRIFPWLQLLVGQVKMFYSTEVVGHHDEVVVTGDDINVEQR